MKYLRPIISLFLLTFSVSAAICASEEQRILAGAVVNQKGESIIGATLTASDARKIISYAVTNSQGKFTMKVRPGAADTLTVKVSGIGYAKKEIRVIGADSNLKFILEQSNHELKEVVVKAATVDQRGDTTSFRLGAFTSKSDITLEDGLKRLPGIEVSAGGAISYLGKNISKFTVEGLQLAGSRYNQITRNLPADYVTKVEVVENFNEAKIDSGRQSDKVAMNIRLANRVRFRPVGTASIGAGVRPGDKGLYSAEGTGMIFLPSFQTMASLKFGNIKEFAMGQTYGEISSGAGSAIGHLGGDTPPLTSRQYLSPLDKLLTLNAIKAFKKDHTLNAHAYYAYTHTDYDYASRATYSTGAESLPIVFSEEYSPTASIHRAGLSADYKYNSRTLWLSNSTGGKFEYRHGSLDALLDGQAAPVIQRNKMRSWSLSNNLSISGRVGKKRYSLGAGLSYTLTPTATINVTGAPSDTSSGLQRADSHKLSTALNTSFDWLINDLSSINFPVSASFTLEDISTDRTPRGSVNDVYGRQGNITVRPTYEFISSNRLFELMAGAGVKLIFLKAGNRTADLTRRLNRGFFSPSLRFAYKPSRRFELVLSGSYDENAGDIAQLLTEGVMTSFRGESFCSGILAKSSILKGDLRANYKNNLTLWFVDGAIGGSRNKRNTLGSIDINGGQVSTGAVANSNYSDALTSSAGIAKHIRSIGLKTALRANFSWGRSEVIQQGVKARGTSTSLSLRPTVTFSPVKWTELQVNAAWSRYRSRYPGSVRTSSGWDNRCRLAFFPIDHLEIYGLADIVSKHDDGVSYPTVCILEAGINWRIKKWRLQLVATNLLDKRHYYYTTFRDLDTFSYDFTLLRRAVTLTATITL